MTRLIRCFALVAVAVAPRFSSAQVRAEPNCTYQSCALGLVPVWNGLAIVRGESERRVGSLGFFMPGDVSEIFRDDRDAFAAAEDAYELRRVGAALTDAGLILVATGLARAVFQREFDKLSGGLTLGGALSLGAGVPFQFAADGALSRAVWLYNRRFSR